MLAVPTSQTNDGKDEIMNLRPNRRALILAGAAAMIAPTFSHAGLFSKDGPVFSKRGKAIRGIDPVAYFADAKPVRGASDISTKWMGANWHFASADNREAFEMDPYAYAPQYGGYCAWAVASGYTASTDPEAWEIFEGKLYLNFSKGVQRMWLEDIPGNIVKGDANWPGLRADLTG